MSPEYERLNRRQFFKNTLAWAASSLIPDPPERGGDLVEGTEKRKEWTRRKYGIVMEVSEGKLKYKIPPITNRFIGPTETYEVGWMVAENWDIPPPLFLALAWSEGFDCYRGIAAQWYEDGTVVLSPGGRAVGIMQIYLPAHPECDWESLSGDLTYNFNQGARILRWGYGISGDAATEGERWKRAVKKYKGPYSAEVGWEKVSEFLASPPINPETKRQVW